MPFFAGIQMLFVKHLVVAWPQPDMQCAYIITMWCVPATSVAAEKQYELHTLSVFVDLGIQQTATVV